MLKLIAQVSATLLLPGVIIVADRLHLHLAYPSPDESTAGISGVYSVLFAALFWSVHLTTFLFDWERARRCSLGQTALGSLLTAVLLVLGFFLFRALSAPLPVYLLLDVLATVVVFRTLYVVGERTRVSGGSS
jgi:hypothetical protein